MMSTRTRLAGSAAKKTGRLARWTAGVTTGLLLGVPILPSSIDAQGRAGPQSVAPLAERLTAAVVNISTSQTVKGPQGAPLPNVPKGSPFEEFFDDFFSKRGSRPQQDRKASSLGSGFIIDAKEGLIVTNNHVIDGADEIIVNLSDGSKLKATRRSRRAGCGS